MIKQAFQLFKQQMEVNRDIVIQQENQLFQQVENSNCKFLNLGCGDRILKGFINVDKFHFDTQVLNYDIYQLPYEKESIDGIFSAHSLEHLPIRHARLAIQNWFNVLKSGGVLYLGVPDIELIFEYFKLTGDIDLFLITLFGFQTDPNNRGNDLDYPVHLGHFHTNGYTKDILSHDLTLCGFCVEEMFNYDGWGTPSIWVKAVK